MGRMAYFSDGSERKFWFACQSTSDIQEFGGHEVGVDMIRMEWDKEDLPDINKAIEAAQEELKVTGYTYEGFMKGLEDRGHMIRSDDREANTQAWKEAEKLCARIELGMHIKIIVERDGSASVEAEC